MQSEDKMKTIEIPAPIDSSIEMISWSGEVADFLDEEADKAVMVNGMKVAVIPQGILRTIASNLRTMGVVIERNEES